MKYLKAMGFAAIVAAALMAFAGVASATTLTGSGGTTLGVGTAISSSAEGTTTLHPPIGDIECSGSAVSGSISNAGGSTATVSGGISELTFTGCNATVTVLAKGSLEIHTSKATANNNGLLTGNGNEVTVEFIGFHCIFKTNGTSLGTVTGSTTTGGNATLDIEASIPRTGGRSGAFCGTEAEWTGSYSVSSPSVLNVD